MALHWVVKLYKFYIPTETSYCQKMLEEIGKSYNFICIDKTLKDRLYQFKARNSISLSQISYSHIPRCRRINQLSPTSTSKPTHPGGKKNLHFPLSLLPPASNFPTHVTIVADCYVSGSCTPSTRPSTGFTSIYPQPPDTQDLCFY